MYPTRPLFQVILDGDVNTNDLKSLMLGRMGLCTLRDLRPRRRVHGCDCDYEAMQCDSQRDRMLLGWGGGAWSTAHIRMAEAVLTPLRDLKMRS